MENIKLSIQMQS